MAFSNDTSSTDSPSNKRCDRCHWLRAWCLCDQAPSLTPDLNLLLLTHEREHAKLSNTGRLLEASLPKATILTWQRKTAAQHILEMAECQTLTPVLLFPSDVLVVDSAQMMHADSIQPDNLKDLLFILLDGTWQQAAKMVRSAPELQAWPRLTLQAESISHYHLRKNQQEGHFSTVETGMLLLQTLGFEGDVDHLDQYFQRFLQHYEAQRSNHQSGHE